MAEYIRREDAVKIAERYGLANGSVLGRHSGLADCIANEILNLPAADVVPVVHGRWVNGKYSNCGVDIPTDDLYDVIWGSECHFCYSCGAKMDGDSYGELK